jgi:hypothetical protein
VVPVCLASVIDSCSTHALKLALSDFNYMHEVRSVFMLFI